LDENPLSYEKEKISIENVIEATTLMVVNAA
jgi:hypothetical protein